MSAGAAANPAGWPRPWTTWTDRDEQWPVPVPWIAGQSCEPDDVCEQRQARTATGGLCQVCGETVSADQDGVMRVSSPAPEWNGALLHDRCCKLTRAFCPHFGGRGTATVLTATARPAALRTG